MKDRQKLFPRKHLIIIFLGFAAISLPCSPILAEPQSQVKPEIKTIRLETFTDRKLLKEGEEINIKIWVDSELIDRANMAVFFPQSQLELKEDLSCQNTEGYYTELQQFAKQKPGQEDLAERLLKIAFDLRDYERDRQETYQNIKEKYQKLAEDLNQIIRHLQK